MSTTQTTVPLSQLRLDPVNVRKGDRGPDPEFVASIRANGVEMPLAARPNGTGYLVTDGGKRLAALQALAERGDIPADHPVPVVVKKRTDTQAKELSLTLNVIRSGMHPVDEFRALAELHRDKSKPLDVDAIATRFGWPRKQIEQRLALGSLDDKILDAWRQGTINADTAKAFTLCASKKAQVELFDKLGKHGRIDDWAVKSALRIGHDNPGRFLAVIGVENYIKRGGRVTEDLFGTDHVVSDPKLVHAMIEEKLAAVRDELLAEGWAWVIDRPNDYYLYGRIQGTIKTPKEKRERLKALETLLNAAEETDEDDPEALAALTEHTVLQGEIARASFTPEQKTKSGVFVHLEREGSISFEFGRIKPAARREIEREKTRSVASGTEGKTKAKSATPVISNALKMRLDVQRTKATKQALLADAHGNALGDLAAKIIASQITPDRPYAMHVSDRDMVALRKTITGKVMNQALRDCFDAKDYFESAPKGLVLAAIRDAVNPDEARKLLGKKRGEIAKFAIANVAKTKWLPAELRTEHYDGLAAKPNGKPKTKSTSKSKRT